MSSLHSGRDPHEESFPEEFREFSEPQKPRRIPRFVTYVTFMSSVLWLIGIYVAHLHPSRTTFAGCLILLALYSGESLVWSFRRRPRREPGRHIQTHSHLTKSDSGFKWIER